MPPPAFSLESAYTGMTPKPLSAKPKGTRRRSTSIWGSRWAGQEDHFRPVGSSSGDSEPGCVAVLPDLKMVSQASVWACHTLVLRLLCSSTGVTIILPNVLIICEGHKCFFISVSLQHSTPLDQGRGSEHSTPCSLQGGIPRSSHGPLHTGPGSYTHPAPPRTYSESPLG